MMKTFKLTLEYDGSDFNGWQVQAGGQRTVQGEIEAVLSRMFKVDRLVEIVIFRRGSWQ